MIDMARLEKALLPYEKRLKAQERLRKWWINAEKCVIFEKKNLKKWATCGGRCMAVCPWNKPMNLLHNSVRWMAINSPNFIKKLLVLGDEIVYDRKKQIDN